MTEGIHPAGSSLPWHDHPVATICCVLRGSFTESWRGGSLTCRPSTLKITPAGERHCDQFSHSAVRGLLIEVSSAQLDSMRPFSTMLEERVSFHGGPTAAIARRISEELRQADATAPLAIEGLLLELVAIVSRLRTPGRYTRAPQWLERTRDLLHANPDARLNLASLAAAADVHPVTLARAFRRAYGCPVGEYVRRLRIEYARRLLLDTDMALAEIALRAGFSDQSHFSNMFRRLTGMSPSRYRRTVGLR